MSRTSTAQFAVVLLLILPIQLLAGTWTALTHSPPAFVNTMLLLSDGTVMAASAAGGSGNNAWYRLTPDSHGSYVNGTWTTIASMNDTRLYFASQVLTNGNVFVAGAEYGTGTNSAEIYNPIANTWTLTPPPTSGQKRFYDCDSEMLPSGNVLIAPVSPATSGGTVIYNVAANTFTAGPKLYRGSYQDEASWIKLPDDSILTIDPFGTNSERYIPSLNQWVNDGNVPKKLYDPYGSELGAAFLLPNGNAFYLGAVSNTAIYTPSGGTGPGTWIAGPFIPNSQGAPDAPAAMMVNGKILCAVSPVPTSADHFPSPTSFYEYDWQANSFTQVNGPTGTTYPSSTYVLRMLDLPDGTVLFSASDNQLYVYQPSGSPLAAGKPTILSLTTNSPGIFHLSGLQLNGISEGAAYGDDAQMNSNYPLIRMTNSASGNVYYARTFNWNSTSVMTGNNPVSTDFTVPASAPPGTYSLVVVANGNASDPISFNYSTDSLYLIPAAGFSSTGPVGGPFSVTSENFTLTNVGAATLNWSLINTSAWINVSASNGSLTAGAATSVTVSLNSVASNSAAGTYSATILFSNKTSHVVQPRQFSLQISSDLVQNGGFETGDFTHWTLNGDGYNYNFVDNGSYFFEPHSGNYLALMGEVGFLSTLSQTLTTTAGQSYLFSCWVNSPDGMAYNECRVAWNGSTLFDQTNMPALGWTNLQFIVTATANSTVIQFGFENDNSYLGLDDVSVRPIPTTVIQSATRTNGTFRLTWNAMSNLVYQLQYKTNLTQASWLNLGNPVTVTNSTMMIIDASASDSQRFYRLNVLP